MKKILLITKLSLQDARKGTPLRIINIAKQLAKNHKVFLVTPAVDEDLQQYLVADVPTVGIRRILKLRSIVKDNGIEIIYANTDTEIVMPVILKILTGTKIVIDLHGLYAEEMYYENLIGAGKKILTDRAVKFFLGSYDLVLAASDKLQEYYQAYNSHIEVLYNGVDLSRFPEANFAKGQVFTIGYMGNTKPYQGFMELLQAAARLRRENSFPFRLNLIISSGAKEIAGWLDQYGLSDITDLHIKVSHSDINRLIGSSHVLIVPRLSTPVTEYAYPSKLPECLLTGIPTVTTAVGPVNKLFGPCQCCLIVRPDNIVDNLAEAINKVQRMGQAETEAMGRKAQEFVRNNLSWSVLGRQLNNYLDKI